MMKENLIRALLFTTGAAVGSAVTWKIVKTKYERLNQEDANAVREYYREKYEDKKEEVTEEVVEDEPEPVPDTSEDAIMEEYVEHVNAYNGTENLTHKEAVDMIRPYIIDAEEFGEIDDYEQITCYYYADGVLATEYDEPIGNIDDVIGLDALKHFGDFAANTVFVRNDRLRADYEVLMSAQNYAGDDDDEYS